MSAYEQAEKRISSKLLLEAAKQLEGYAAFFLPITSYEVRAFGGGTLGIWISKELG